MGKKYLAFDFGASSGRATLGEFDGSKIHLSELHRFQNDPVEVHGSLYWDVLRLFFEVKQGMANAVKEGHGDIASIGVDTWGVDFGLLDKRGQLLGNPYHYRDVRTEGMLDKTDELIGLDYVFNETGIQSIWFNTLYQLLSMKQDNSPHLTDAESLLFMPDLFNYMLTGEKASEYTIASTSQLLNAHSRTWAEGIIDKLGFPHHIFGCIVHPGQRMGTLTSALRQELQMGDIPVTAVGSHDTASAVAAVPAQKGEEYVYISSGTWSLMGVELTSPFITEKSRGYNFTNEGGVNNSIRFLKNIMGLWLVQECRRQWIREGESFTFADLENAARGATPFRTFIDPDYGKFAPPGNMPRRIREFAANTGQPSPETPGEVIRAVYESLALKYRYTVQCLRDMLGKKFDCLHIVGGGIKDKMLCQFTADATGLTVVAGPTEATSMGNIGAQLIGTGEASTLEEVRSIISNSFERKIYTPRDTAVWDAAFERFMSVQAKDRS